jgi:ATP-dependent DNA helicase PIF1
VNIGGCTLHSWAGIGLGKESVKALSGKFLYQMKYEPVKRRWQSVRALIIDESKLDFGTYFLARILMPLVSMIDGKLFDKLVRL